MKINQNSNVTSRAVTNCGFIPELSSSPFIPEAQHEPAILTPCCDPLVGGSDPVQSLIFKSGNDLYRVYTLDLFDNSLDYIVVDQNNEIFFLLYTQDEYLSGHSKEIALPKGLNLAASFSHSNLRERNLTLAKATTSIGDKANITSINGELLIDITNTNDDDVNALVRYDWCKYVIPSTIRKYKNELMSSYEIIESDFRLDNAIEEAVLACTPNLCLDCADSRCVLDAILEHPQLFPIPNSAEVKTDIKINYLRLLLDLTDKQIDWLKNNPSILDDLFETYDLNFKGNGQLETRGIGCDLNICGAEGAANAHINLLMNEVNDEDIDDTALCDFFTCIYEEDFNTYKYLVEPNFNSLFYSPIIPIESSSCNSPVISVLVKGIIDKLIRKLNDDYGFGISAQEQALIDSNPFKTLEVLLAANDAFVMTEIYFGSSTTTNTCGDAFRHALWAAVSAYRTDSSFASSFLTAHESDTPQAQFLSEEMDLFNNSIGIMYHQNNPSFWAFAFTQSVFDNLICDGELKVFEDPNANPQSNTQLIFTNNCEECD